MTDSALTLSPPDLTRTPSAPPVVLTKKVRRRVWPYLALVLLLGAGSGVAFMRSTKPVAIDQALVVTAERGGLSIEVLDVGRVEAFEEVEILSKVAGRVAEVHVQDGDSVISGQSLITLDRRDFARAVQREQALLETAVARAEFADRNLKRKMELFREGLVPATELDVAEKEARLLRLDVRTAKVALQVARDGHSDARILAPTGGTIIRRQIEPGEMVVPGVESSFDKSALLMIADLSRLVVRVELNQIDVAKVKLGQRVTATFDGLPGEEFGARVTEIARASTKTKELDVFPVKAELDFADLRVRPGMTADVRIHIEEKDNVLTVPLESVSHESGKAFVKRVVAREQAEETERVEVVLGTQNDRMAEIVSGVSEGERVLLDPPSSKENEKAL